MPTRPRSLRASRLPLKRSLRPLLEDLEIRLVLSTQQFSATPEFVIFNPPGGTAAEGRSVSIDGIPGPFSSSLTPAQIQSYYGANAITFGDIKGDGAGQTIALVDAYDDPALVDSTSAGFATSDLAEFDKYFGLPDPPSFTKYSETGSTTTLPAASTPGGWDVEESLDVEWAHVMAPAASIDLVEATTQEFQTDMVAAVQEAASLPGVSVVSMSFGYPELPDIATYNSDFTTPAGHQGVTFVSATSDTGSFGVGGIDPFSGQPAFLPNVISVGGTSLATAASSPTLESAWNQGGGGVSQYVPEPSYQDGVQDTGKRTAPDVSADANANFGGVAVYDSYSFGTADPWNQIGGTSLATPLWAGLIAVANQGRVAAGGTTLDGPTQTLPALYSLPYDDFNDILAGDNEGEGAAPGYDEITGLGSPRANLLVPDLAAYGLSGVAGASHVDVTTQPPSTVDPGETFGLSAAVQDSFGNTDTGFSGTATLTSSVTGNVVATIPVTGGVAIFDGLTLASGQSATYTVAITVDGVTKKAETATVTASTTAEPTGSETLYPAPSYDSLVAALQKAAADSATNITIVLEAGTYALDAATAAPLLIENTSGLPLKTITIRGAGTDQTTIVPTSDKGWDTSIFEVLGQTGAEVQVKIQGLTIQGGEATSGGILGGNAAAGGGLLNDGGNVTLSQVAFVRDVAVGNPGTVGATGSRKRQGSPGGSGKPAAGGGVYMAGGTLSLVGVTFLDDIAQGGRGGTGGVGGTDGGGGGPGGAGGSASGGGLYVAGGTVTGSRNAFRSDAALGGSGGYGGHGGLGGTAFGLGTGGHGGAAGMGFGGALYMAGGSVSLGSTPITNDLAKGGHGGTGGLGGFSHPFVVGSSSGFTTFSGLFYGRGGLPGGGADAEGGGVYVGGGSLTLGVSGAAATAIQHDRALGGFFGFTGDSRYAGLAAALARHGAHIQHGPSNPGAPPVAGHHDQTSSSSSSAPSFQLGSATGGAIYVEAGSVTLVNQDVANDQANHGGGIFNAASGSVKATGLTMASDSAEVGGAILNHGALTIATGVISGNRAAEQVDGYSIGSFSSVAVRGSTGGGIANYGRLGLQGVTISSNNAHIGGGIYNHSGSISANSLNLVGNSAITHGGGIYTVKGALTITGGTVKDNSVSATGSSPSVAVGSGGGIDAVSGKVAINGVGFTGNAARAGGGLYLASGSATITNSNFTNNLARQYGGALDAYGNMDITGGTFAGNTARIDGGAIDNFASLTIDFATMSGNSAGGDGGAINNPATMTLDGLTISGNTAGSLGGGVDTGGTLTLIASTLSTNQANDGGGIFDVGAITMKNGDVVKQNIASANGGGIDMGSGGQIKATGLAVTDNSIGTGNGGGIFDQRGALTITGGEISGNAAVPTKLGDTLGWGGGVYDTGGKVSLSSTPVENNTAVDGGGLYITSGSVSLQGEQLESNTAVQFGGGIYSQGTVTLTSTTVTLNVAQDQDGGGIESLNKLTMTNSVLSRNTATAGSGGDLYNGPKGDATITQSTLTTGLASTGGDAASAGSLTISTTTISYGSATTAGGGIANIAAGTLQMANSTVADNASTGNGGGIDSQGTLTAVNVTIAYNSVGASGSGGGLDVESGTTALSNTIVDVNTAAGGTDVTGTLSASSSNNLFGILAPSAVTGSDPNLVNVTAQQADLGPLADNGGPTFTIALLEVDGTYSPAIDGGSNALAFDPSSGQSLITDQRGALRGTKGINAGATVDIGAFEASSSYLVTSSADSSVLAGTLRSGVSWAKGSTNDNPENIANPAPNTIVFDTTGSFAIPQTITLTSTLALPDNPAGVEIMGPGGGVVNISGAGQFQVIKVSGGTAVLQGITILDGSAATGGGIGNAGNLTLDDVVLMGNSAAQGGGVYSDGTGSSLTIDGGTIEDNSASLTGGGVYSAGSLSLANATIEGNSAAQDGGGIEMPDAGTLAMTGSTITQNAAADLGGGLYLASVDATVTGGSISGNSAVGGGGMYSGLAGSSLTITGTSLTGNSAQNGGAIDATGNLTISAASLSGNSAGNGGAINNGQQASITASTLTANVATGHGGAIDNNGGTLQVSASTLAGNSAASGGGIYSVGTLTVGGSTLSGNSASSAGGGILDGNGLNDVVTNTTLVGNSAGSMGGGIYSTLSKLSLVNATIAYNALSSGSTGAGLDSAAGSVGLYNTLIDLNTGTGATDVAGTVAGSSNIIGTATGSGLTNGVDGDQVGVTNPGLATSLANNGGPTQTLALVAGSPAINAGAYQIAGVTIPTIDQRGALRGAPGNAGGLNAGDAPDVGAYDASSEYVVTTTADSNDLSTLRTGVSWANVSINVNPANIANPAPNTVEFDATAPFNSARTIALSPALGTLVLSNTTTPVAIDGPGTNLLTISGGGAVGVLQVQSGVTADLENVTVSGGAAASGAGINNAGTLTITLSTIEANTVTGSGGGISNTGTLTLGSGTSVSGNTAAVSGGGVYNTGSLDIDQGATVTSNSATTSGGGIDDLGTLNLIGTPNLGGVQVNDNSAAGTGGGISVAGTLNASAATISGNSASASGGGIAVLAGGTVNLTSIAISTNDAGSSGVAGNGAGIDNAGTLTLGSSTVTGNSASGSGGGIEVEPGGVLTSTYSDFTGNMAGANGAGIDNGGAATISVATIASNTAGTTGGGIGNEPGGTLTLSGSTLSGNSAASGGGLANAGTANLSNATIAANQAPTGGGVYDYDTTGTLTAVNATIADNLATGNGTGGGIDAVGGTTVLYNTIVALNTSGIGAASDAFGSLSTGSSNDLFGTGGSGGLAPTALNAIQVNVKNPQLHALQDDGGPTETIALLAGSPAIDAGSASIPGVTVPTVDQRGALRGPAGLNAGSQSDIGAYEASSSYQVNTTTDSTAMGTLRAAIAWANVSINANPANLAPNTTAPNTAVFNTAGAFATAQTITISPTLGPIALNDRTQSGESIDGTASNGLTISGGGKTQVFSVAADATATLAGLTITGGWSPTSGGAIVNSGNLTVDESTLTGNSAASGGGAIDDLGRLNIQSSTLNNNSAVAFGGAVDDESKGSFTVMNSTIVGNSAGAGGGLYSTGTLSAINDTIAYNASTAAHSGGGLNAPGGATSLYNTIVAANTDSSGGDPADDIAGTITGSYNLVGTGGSGGLTNGVDGNQVGVADAGLGSGLAGNGGPTQTISLLATSPALGVAPPTADGQIITYDQRGALRGSSGTTSIDIGAFELSDEYLVTSAQDSTVPGTLRSAINWADTSTASGLTTPLVIKFDTSHLFATPQVITLGLGTLALTNTVRPIVIDGPGAGDVTISGNGAVGVFSIAAGVTANIMGVTITDGMAAAGGGINNAGTLIVGSAAALTSASTDVALIDNTSPSGSGAAIDNTGTLAVYGGAFSGNAGSYYGGAIFNDDGAATITDSNFVDNTTTYGLGGAIDNLGGTLTVTGGTFQGNTSFQGGAIYNRNDSTSKPATAVVNGVTISGNSAYQGGGLFNEGTMSVSNSTVADNTAFQGGAASNDFGGTMTITDSTLAANTANQYGGAIDNVATLTLVSDTVAYNVVTPGGSGAGIEAYSGTTALYDTIAVLNTVGTGTSAPSDDITGHVAAGSSYNLVGTGGLTNGVNNNIVGTTNPGLASGLASNGGPTQTIALFTGSPAIGAGSASIAGVTVPATDQRGAARPTTGFDIGAYQGSIAAPTTTAAQSAIVAAPVDSTPVTAAATLAPVITGPSPFSGRHLDKKGHRQAKAKTKTAHHPAAVAHKAVKADSAPKKTVKVRLAKKR